MFSKTTLSIEELKQIKSEYKKNLPKVEEMRKKNFIGDQIIVEKEEVAEMT